MRFPVERLIYSGRTKHASLDSDLPDLIGRSCIILDDTGLRSDCRIWWVFDDGTVYIERIAPPVTVRSTRGEWRMRLATAKTTEQVLAYCALNGWMR